MCDFEKNILQLLKEEKKNLSTVVANNDLPYMKSLEYGIQNAEKKLAECECKKKFYSNELVPASQLNYWSKMTFEFLKCKELS